jgi:hypothetical protein
MIFHGLASRPPFRLRLKSRDVGGKHTQAWPQFGCEDALSLQKIGTEHHDFEK